MYFGVKEKDDKVFVLKENGQIKKRIAREKAHFRKTFFSKKLFFAV